MSQQIKIINERNKTYQKKTQALKAKSLESRNNVNSKLSIEKSLIELEQERAKQ